MTTKNWPVRDQNRVLGFFDDFLGRWIGNTQEDLARQEEEARGHFARIIEATREVNAKAEAARAPLWDEIRAVVPAEMNDAIRTTRAARDEAQQALSAAQAELVALEQSKPDELVAIDARSKRKVYLKEAIPEYQDFLQRCGEAYAEALVAPRALLKTEWRKRKATANEEWTRVEEAAQRLVDAAEHAARQVDALESKCSTYEGDEA